MARLGSLMILILVLAVGTFLVYMFKSPNPEDKDVNKNLVLDFSHWSLFTAPEGQFKVFLPSLPHHATEFNQELKHKEMRHYELFVSSKDNGNLFSVYLISFPARKKENDLKSNFLMNFMEEVLQNNPNNKITVMKTGAFNHDKAVEFSVENQDTMIDGKAFMKDNTIYVLLMTSKIGNRSMEEFNYFLNSFEMIPKM